MIERIQKGDLGVTPVLYRLISDEILPGTGLDADRFWAGFDKLAHILTPKNKALLARRESLQTKIDDWHKKNPAPDFDFAAYKAFLQEIGYLIPEGKAFTICTKGVDAEIATIPGPQLVVPVMNARFALNAANARWGSLYDALYGTDMIAQTGALKPTKAYNQSRGEEVIRQAAAFLDQACPLERGNHQDVVGYRVKKGQLNILLKDSQPTVLRAPEKFAGYSGAPEKPESILLKNNHLHIELQIDPAHPIGKSSAAGIKDIMLESAVSAIQDCEDSVAAVDGKDKILVYRNWLGLMKGDLVESFEKNGKTITRRLAPDRTFKNPAGESFVLPGRSLLLVRNVGHLMTSNAILMKDGAEIPEGILDAVITALCAIHDFNKKGVNANSRENSLYIVKPKMHGPEEAAFTDEIFNAVEDLLELPRHTIKVGVMDEERRTTVNLKECIRAVQNRIVFINTGFLDRTGDEIHTSMEAGAFLPKEDIKGEPWINAYENWNVDIGLECGFSGKAQIGKGMWPKPDEMNQMKQAKISHPEAGANCAWVPSPTAATIHAMHYHEIDVFDRQAEIAKRKRADIDDILTIPLLGGRNLSDEMIRRELENNAQGLLGYMVRWVEQGVGCSKVPDINNVGLMEDRATLRISSQHLANWLHHGICSQSEVSETLERMAKVVDGQNAGDPDYRKMAPDFDNSVAFQAAREIIFDGRNQPSGYTEPVLHRRRLEAKEKFNQ